MCGLEKNHSDLSRFSLRKISGFDFSFQSTATASHTNPAQIPRWSLLWRISSKRSTSFTSTSSDACSSRRKSTCSIWMLRGFHIWRPQNDGIFYPLPPSHCHNSADFVPFVCFFGTPLPPLTADVIYGRPQTTEGQMQRRLYDTHLTQKRVIGQWQHWRLTLPHSPSLSVRMAISTDGDHISRGNWMKFICTVWIHTCNEIMGWRSALFSHLRQWSTESVSAETDRADWWGSISAKTRK